MRDREAVGERHRGTWRPSRISIAASAFVLILALAPLPAKATETEAAMGFVRALGAETLRVLTDRDAQPAHRAARIRQLISDNFDFWRIGRFVVGSAWRKASQGQKGRFQALFKTWLLDTYARRLDGYGGEVFEVLDARPMGRRDVLVMTRIHRPGGKPVRAGWRLGTTSGRFRILDLVIEGMSMAVVQRAEFRTVIRRDGLDGLIETLAGRTAKAAASRQRQLVLNRN